MNYVDIRFSKDGGHKFCDWRKVPMGETGDFLFPVIVRQLGISRHWVIEWRITDDCRGNLIAAAVQMEPAGA